MIYLIRHGHDDERFIGGWSDAHLTPEGVKQSVNARNFIVNKGLVINKILSSDITRAKETARIINSKLMNKIKVLLMVFLYKWLKSTIVNLLIQKIFTKGFQKEKV